MPPPNDFVRDSKLNTEFCDSLTIHSYLEIAVGRRFCRKERWKGERLLGRGGFGQVELQRCVTNGAKPDCFRAVKMIEKPLPGLHRPLDFNRELEAIAKFSNERFVRSFGWYEDKTSIFITMEYCCHGDLFHYLEKNRSVPVGVVRQLAFQILEGLDQMHQNEFAHRDLKPGNILIKSMPPTGEWWIVLADFGISKRADESNGPTTVISGTPTYMAPELQGYLNQPKPKLIADFKPANIWALGVIMFQMLTGGAAFSNPPNLVRYCTGVQEFPASRLPITLTDDGREFVTGLMTALPQDRLTTTQCIQHRWMDSLRVEEEFAAPNLGQSGLPVPQPSWGESASARWSRLSDFEPGPTRTIAQGTERPLHSEPSGTSQIQLACTSSDPSFESYPWSGRLLQTLEGHSGPVNSVAFSPDGKRLASASWDKTVRLWFAGSGRLLQTLKGRSGPVYSVAFSPDGERLASASDKTVRLWDARSGRRLQKLVGYRGIWESLASPYWVVSVAFSPNSMRLACASFNKTVRLWHVGIEER